MKKASGKKGSCDISTGTNPKVKENCVVVVFGGEISFEQTCSWRKKWHFQARRMLSFSF